MEGAYSVALGQILAKCCQVVCGPRHPVQNSPLDLRLEVRTMQFM